MGGMDKNNRDTQIDAYFDELTEIRRDIHQHPETAYEENRTADIVGEKTSKPGGWMSIGRSGRPVWSARYAEGDPIAPSACAPTWMRSLLM